jgi:hypothetical protein
MISESRMKTQQRLTARPAVGLRAYFIAPLNTRTCRLRRRKTLPRTPVQKLRMWRLRDNFRKITGSLRSRSQSQSPSQLSLRSKLKDNPVAQNAVSDSTTATQATDKSSRLWREALEKLPPEDQRVLSACPKPLSKLELLQSMLEITERRQQEWDSKRWKVTVGGREVVFAEQATKIIGWLNKFKTVGDVAVSYDPVYAALPWAAVRFILEATVAETQVIEVILPSVERTMNLIGRYRIYEELYLDDDQMQSPDNTQGQLRDSLTTLYTAVLRFLSKVCRFYNRTTVSRIADAILNRGDLEDFLHEIERCEARAHRDADNCYSKISGLKMQENLQKTQQLVELLRTWDVRISVIHDGLEESKRTEILSWVSKVEYERLHNHARESRVDNSGQWLLKHRDYLAWSGSSHSMILWLHGVRKSGKGIGIWKERLLT